MADEQPNLVAGHPPACKCTCGIRVVCVCIFICMRVCVLGSFQLSTKQNEPILIITQNSTLTAFN